MGNNSVRSGVGIVAQKQHWHVCEQWLSLDASGLVFVPASHQPVPNLIIHDLSKVELNWLSLTGKTLPSWYEWDVIFCSQQHILFINALKYKNYDNKETLI